MLCRSGRIDDELLVGVALVTKIPQALARVSLASIRRLRLA